MHLDRRCSLRDGRLSRQMQVLIDSKGHRMDDTNSSDSKSTEDTSEAGDKTPPSFDDAVHGLTAHVSSAVDQHAERAKAAIKRTNESGYDLTAIQKDLFDAYMQVVTDSLKAVSHMTSIARAAADKR